MLNSDICSIHLVTSSVTAAKFPWRPRSVWRVWKQQKNFKSAACHNKTCRSSRMAPSRAFPIARTGMASWKTFVSAWFIQWLWSVAALNANSKNFSDSEVFSRWKKQFEELREKFELLKDRANGKLSSHSNKKGSAQSMVENPSVSGIALITRAAWCTKDAHTLFDCVEQSSVLSRQSGKALAK